MSIRSIASVAAALTLCFSATASASGRYAAIVIDAATSEVLHQDEADEPRFPASLAKMMTLYLMFEAIEHGDITEDTVLTASRNAARQPRSSLGLQVGDQMRVEDAILSLVVQSANDVATMVGEQLGGSESRFAALMTAQARELGMSNTVFANASGLPDPRQHTTARDMARLGQALWRDFPDEYCYFQAADFSWNGATMRNHNHLLRQVDGVDGIKTGYTIASGFNLVSSAERNGRRLIVVVMGGESASSRDAQAAYLLNGAFANPARATFAGAPAAQDAQRVGSSASRYGPVAQGDTADREQPSPARR